MARLIVENAAAPGKSLPPPTDVSWGALPPPAVPAFVSAYGPLVNFGPISSLGVTVDAAAQTLYAFALNDDIAPNRLTMTYWPEASELGGNGQPMTKIAERTDGAQHWITAWRLRNPTVSAAGAHIKISDPRAQCDYAGAMVLSGAGGEGTPAYNVGTSATSSCPLAPGTGLPLNFAAWQAAASGSLATPLAGGPGHISRFAKAQSAAGGGAGYVGEGGGTGSWAPTWAWGQSRPWWALAFEVRPA